ncbi:MAG: hypothetical protein IJ091_03425 [Oscillospiraceae bacterium]|nr:hypothetical protein [Oscillospiraceae bacterium]
MTYYTEKGAPIFNTARQKAFTSLDKTLSQLYGNTEITEMSFRDVWLSNMEKEGDIIPDGWYCPPPRGTAVLGNERVKFDSLRNDYNWSGETRIDWKGVLYAYASPVDLTDGRIGDISVTLYFGEDQKVVDHIRNCFEATVEVFERLGEASCAGDVFWISQEIFRNHQLKSLVISRTDDMPINLGHTFPALSVLPKEKVLSEQERMEISTSRKFLNGSADWNFEDGLQFTVEPQLVSMVDESLPKITQHYLVKAAENDFIVCNDIDSLLKKYGSI